MKMRTLITIILGCLILSCSQKKDTSTPTLYSDTDTNNTWFAVEVPKGTNIIINKKDTFNLGDGFQYSDTVYNVEFIYN